MHYFCFNDFLRSLMRVVLSPWLVLHKTQYYLATPVSLATTSGLLVGADRLPPTHPSSSLQWYWLTKDWLHFQNKPSEQPTIPSSVRTIVALIVPLPFTDKEVVLKLPFGASQLARDCVHLAGAKWSIKSSGHRSLVELVWQADSLM